MTDAALPQETSTQHDAKVAVRNAVQLGLSLVATYGVGVAIRMFFLPRTLGHEAYGVFTAADAVANTAFLFTTLGMEPYTQKEVSVRPGHASDFVGGVMVLRVVMTLIITAGMSLYLALNDQSTLMRMAALGMAGMYAFYHHNGAWAALLTASREVGGLAKINVATKLVWGAATITFILAGGGVLGAVAAFLLSEALKAIFLHFEAFRRLPLKLRIDWAGTFQALKNAFPFMLNSISLLYGRLDVNMMSYWHISASELGWYGAATQISSFTLILLPLLSGAVLPLFSRAAARSKEELNEVAGRTLSVVLSIGIAGAATMALGAELAVRMTAGPTFLPAVTALVILCGNFVITYVAMISSYVLWARGKTWTMTGISALGLLVNPVFNIVFIRPLAERGPGWAGTGAALATVSTELFVTAILLCAIGRGIWSRRLLSLLARTLLVVVAVAVLHVKLSPLVDAPPPWLGSPHGIPVLVAVLLVEIAVYVGLAAVIGALNVREMLETVRSSLRSRKEPGAA